MDYKEQWEEMKRWLEHGIDYCKSQSQQTKDRRETDRLLIKANAMDMMLGRMLETERTCSR